MVDLHVDVTGTRDLQGALRGTSVAFSGELRAQLTDSARMIVRGAQSLIPRRTGAARASLDVQPTDNGAEIVAGGRRAPYFGWLDFGGSVGRRQRTVRTYLRDGRYLFPTVVRNLNDIRQAAEEAVRDAGERNGVTFHG